MTAVLFSTVLLDFVGSGLTPPAWDRSATALSRADITGADIITTVAGTGALGDGRPATSAQLSEPAGVAVDANGNLFIADSGNNRVRKVAAGTGIITTVAGSGERGFSGDGGPARNAQLGGPSAVAVDASGNLFVAEFGNGRIRKVGTAPPTCPDAPPPAGLPLTISLARAQAGDTIILGISGVARETVVAAFSRTNSGALFRGHSLLLRTDLGVLFSCRLSGVGSCSQRFTIPQGTSGLFFFQPGRSSDPTFQSGTFSLTNNACLTIR